jgi:hypothetical protein
MTPQITWKITAMNCSTTEQNPNTVITAHWTCAGTEGTDTASVYSTCSLPAPTGTFTPFDKLTPDQVLGWIWANGVDKFATEAAVVQQLDDHKKPPVVTPKLPWAA